MAEDLLRQRVPVLFYSHPFDPGQPRNGKSESQLANLHKCVSVINRSPHRKAMRRASPLDRFDLIIGDPTGDHTSNKLCCIGGNEANARSSGIIRQGEREILGERYSDNLSNCPESDIIGWRIAMVTQDSLNFENVIVASRWRLVARREPRQPVRASSRHTLRSRFRGRRPDGRVQPESRV